MADWTSIRRLWEKWASSNVGSSGEPLKGALLINYDPNGPSRLLPIIAEQEGTDLKAFDLQPFLDYIKRNALQTEFFSIGSNQYMVTSIHEHWFPARCINSSKSGGEGAIIMQIGNYLLVAIYEGSLGAASQAMLAVDKLAWQMARRNH
ncbi:hypothetical protein LUZ60_009971 [Juncus effusus]|nr:hypothetical protein LUZ60_009971 [Juncus effusus]